MGLRITTLGGLRVELDGERVHALDRRPSRAALLVYLAVEREATRQSVINVFWSEAAPGRGRKALNQALYELREVLGRGWEESMAEPIRVSDDTWTDAAAFLRAVEDEEFDMGVTSLGGPFLDGFGGTGSIGFEQWVDRIDSRIRRKARLALRSVIHAARSRGDAQAVLALAQKWRKLDPLEDEAVHALLLALTDVGRRADALQRYEAFAEALRSTLDIEPDERCIQLVDVIRRSADVATRSWDRTPTVPEPTQDEATEDGEEGPLPSDVRAGELQSLGPIPGIEPLRLLRRGTMADVYLARELSLHRLVALKVLPTELTGAQARLRFEREARAVAQIVHPHVVPVLRADRLENGCGYYVMPYVRGVNLAEHLAAVGPFSPARLREILASLASALAYVHALGVIHRDVSPANVLVEETTDDVFLTDFGVAGLADASVLDEISLTRTGEGFGDPSYRSPEHMDGKPIDDRADVYSLGVLAFELRHGWRPTDPDDETREERQIEPDPGLDALIARCLRRGPRKRPSAREVVKALEGRPGSRWRLGHLVDRALSLVR